MLPGPGPSQGDNELKDSVTWVRQGSCGGRNSVSFSWEAQDGAGQWGNVERNPHHDEGKVPDQETCAKSSKCEDLRCLGGLRN